MCDELIILDVTASKLGKSPNFSLIKAVVSECDYPVTYGGGLKSIEDVDQIFDCGVEKVSFQSTFFEKRNIVEQTADKYGNQSVVISIDLTKDKIDNYKLHLNPSRVLETNIENLLKSASEFGEVFVMATHKEGTRSGPDIDLINQIATHISCPLIYGGGVSNINDMYKVFEAGADAVGVGAMFVFHGIHNAVLLSYPTAKDRELAGIF
jgi:cyclase